MSDKKAFQLLEPESDDVGSTTENGTDAEDEEDGEAVVKEPTVTICGKKFDSLSLLIIAGVIFAGLVTLGLLISIALGLNDNMRGSTYTRGAVASDSSVCSEIGYAILKRNGSAVDSAIATLTCLGVVRFHSAGIGGGGSMVVRNGTGAVSVIDYRETAPVAATQNMFVGNVSQAAVGGLAVAVPGQMKGLTLAHHLHGRLAWSELILPSVKVARDGFKLEQSTYDWAGRQKANLRTQTPRLYNLLFTSEGEQVTVGSTLQLPDLANLLQVIADSGSGDVLYNGSSITQRLVEAVGARGGTMATEDLTSYAAVAREALSTTIRSNTFYTSPPPSSGVTVLSVLSILQGYGPMTGSVLSYHRMLEAMKFAFVRRAGLGDTDLEPSVAQVVANMISQEETARLGQMINDSSTLPLSEYGAQSSTTAAPGTVHVSIERGEQEAVSVTESLGSPFGSFVLSPDGFLLNNAMNDFSVPGAKDLNGYPTSSANYIKPRKRPLSSMAPVIVVEVNKNDTIALRSVVGAGGGPAIPSTVLEVLLNMLDRNMDVSNAVAAPRLHQRISPNIVSVEAAFPGNLAEGLRQLGHVVVTSNYTIGHCTAIHQNSASPRRLKAASDRRNGGVASYGALFKQKK